MSQSDEEGQQLAVLAESLYVANLLILPGLAFIILGIIFLKHHDKAPPLAQAHLEQTMAACVGMMVMAVVAVTGISVLFLNEVDELAIWIIIVILFTIIHASMVLLGVLGLAKAMAGKCWRFPVFGRTLPPACPK